MSRREVSMPLLASWSSSVGQDGWRDNHAVADDAGGVVVEDACGNQVQRELAMRVVDGVTGIRPAGETDHHAGLLGQQVNDLALAFVTPLDSDDYGYWHRTSPVSRRPGMRTGTKHVALNMPLTIVEQG